MKVLHVLSFRVVGDYQEAGGIVSYEAPVMDRMKLVGAHIRFKEIRCSISESGRKRVILSNRVSDIFGGRKRINIDEIGRPLEGGTVLYYDPGKMIRSEAIELMMRYNLSKLRRDIEEAEVKAKAIVDFANGLKGVTIS